MYYTIYKITNKINNKTYIGKHQTQNLEDDYIGSGKILWYAIKKYGKENFTKEILFVFNNEEDMNSKEAELVVVSEQTYNLCPGGKGGFGYINSLNIDRKDRGAKGMASLYKVIKEKYNVDHPSQIPSNRKLYSIKMKELHKAGKLKSTKGFTGKHHTQEFKNKIGIINSVRQTGTRNSQYDTCWITNGTVNKKIRKEQLDSYIQQGYYKGRKMNKWLSK